jgi:hypothetical protein
MATPAFAAGEATAPAISQAQPAGEAVGGMQLDGNGNIVIIVLAIIAVGLGIWALLDNGNDHPASP